MIVRAPEGLHAGIHDALRPIGCIFPTAESVEDVIQAEKWLKTQGCRKAYGPMYPHTWYPYRACLGPFERAPFLGEPLFTPDIWQACGYTIVSRYSSTLCPNAAEIARHVERKKEFESTGWRFFSLAEEDVSLTRIHELTLQSFKSAFAYTPLELNDFLAMYGPILQRADTELIRFAMTPSQNIVGYCFSIPDFENPDLKQFIVKTLAVLPEVRQRGVGGILVGDAHQAAERKGWVNGGIHALMWEGSNSQRITAHEGQHFRDYALFSKDL